MKKRMTASDNAFKIIKEFEGLRYKTYKCPAGILTIGYGHTGTDVVPGMEINAAYADAVLKLDIKKFENAVNRLVNVQINQNQFDALVSFTFNVGEGKLESSTLLRKVNAGDVQAGEEFSKWVYGGGKILPGLIKRRAAEKALFNLKETA